MDEFGHDSSSDEFVRLVNVCLTVFSSLTYCYFISRNIPKGFPRLLSILPIIYIFTLIPLNLSSFHLTMTAGWFISWFASFKLVLFSFDKGPLSYDPPLVSSSSPSRMTFLRFHVIACLPIKVKQSNQSSVRTYMHWLHYYVLEGVCLGLVFYSYGYYKQHQDKQNFWIMNFLYLLYACSSSELTLVFYATLVRLLFDIDVDPPYGNYFFLSTSFQDFWGRRWNLAASDILRSTVYEPVRHAIKRSWGVYIAILVTFFISGLMHELLIFCVFRKQPYWDVLLFFILHGICMAVEIKVKRSSNGKWQINQLLSILLMNGFLVCSCFWLLFPFFGRFKFPFMVIEDIANFTKLLNNVLS
ncbi:hypothetical protein MKW98_030540 [Papaver atlanticum]|uniref:Wax synthase domain-containing protein n=1 Tax=Papaver atlanticum TaxID=357466 RepID=A0AAD4XSX0_9MAGN|nr:hypothetical protein MKW98_030540 [Papaver atlanticum]